MARTRSAVHGPAGQAPSDASIVYCTGIGSIRASHSSTFTTNQTGIEIERGSRVLLALLTLLTLVAS